MNDENRVIKFGYVEIAAKDIRYYKIYSLSTNEIFIYHENALSKWKTKRLNNKEFFEIMKKSGYINDSVEFDKIIDEICPKPIIPYYNMPLHYLHVSTLEDIYDFFENEVDFDIFEKLSELNEIFGEDCFGCFDDDFFE